jgi:hypothetical protein
MSQKDLADAIGLQYYTMVSQMELGYISVPASLWVPISNALSLDRVDWVLECLLEIQPQVFFALFGKRPRDDLHRLLSSDR